MLDLSIKDVTKYYNNSNIETLLTQNNHVSVKYDGVKLTLYKFQDTGRAIDDFIVSYKGQVFYNGEFDYVTNSNLTYGNGQFKQVFDHLNKVGSTDIPVGTELFCEFLVKKPTVMSEYSLTGAIILIDSRLSNYQLNFGKISFEPSETADKTTLKYAKELKINVPEVLIDGPLFPHQILLKSCQNGSKRFKPSSKLANLTGVEYYNQLKEEILALDSAFGGKEEGIVISNNDGLFKVQQEYQLSKEDRTNKKSLFKYDDLEQENSYWKEIIDISERIGNKVLKIEQYNIALALKMLSNEIATLELLKMIPNHDKKNVDTIKDDIQTNAKNFILKHFKGNDGALVIGKFRVFTNGHLKMINKALKESDNVVIGLVSGKSGNYTQGLRFDVLNKVFKGNPKVKIINLQNGNLFTAFKKAEININKIYCGSDRLKEYQKMLQFSNWTNVIEIERSNEDISASKVISNLNDETYFKNNTPEPVWTFYNQYQEEYL